MNEKCRVGDPHADPHLLLDQAQGRADPDQTPDPKTDTKLTSLNRMTGLFWYSNLCHIHTYIQLVQVKD